MPDLDQNDCNLGQNFIFKFPEEQGLVAIMETILLWLQVHFSAFYAHPTGNNTLVE